MVNFTREHLRAVVEGKGYKFFDGGKAYNLNLIGIRRTGIGNDEFNDLLTVTYKDEMMNWHCRIFGCTTEPGAYYLLNPLPGTGGTAIMLEDQYDGLYMLGKHKGQDALEQKGKAVYVRDSDLNNQPNISPAAKRIVANLKTNIHRATNGIKSIRIGRWSAGCQVLSNSLDFDELLRVCRIAASKYGNSFTYTLINWNDL